MSTGLPVDNTPVATSNTPVIPGVLLTSAGRGVLLTGPSGSGKSDCALALLARGYALVADDAVHLERCGDRLIGRAPPTAPAVSQSGCATMHSVQRLHIRDLGFIDVGACFGRGAIAESAAIALEVVLQPERGETHPDSTLYGRHQLGNRLGIEVPQYTITAAPQRPVAALIELVCTLYKEHAWPPSG
ncbi:hypothetical protein CKO15_02045 [Halorhodospira abdelmalekii]|uniref:HPr kinase/phosphorylase n=1 Tax=Halorhodospira abdelmalekii TaxID=421629 RepID=UPI0019041C2D|nr:hypothetical protein [Halorhodospira abdelmalekii]MBK1734081.1 hypothetical protein [Halorhodospira abdelmalekii]